MISVFHILPGLYLNFSSTSAELAIGLVIARRAAVHDLPSPQGVGSGDAVCGPHLEACRNPKAMSGRSPCRSPSPARRRRASTASWPNGSGPTKSSLSGDFLTQGIRTGSRDDATRPRLPSDRPRLAGAVRPGRFAGHRAGHRADRFGGRLRGASDPDARVGGRVQLEARQSPLPERRPQAVPDLAHA